MSNFTIVCCAILGGAIAIECYKDYSHYQKSRGDKIIRELRRRIK